MILRKVIQLHFMKCEFKRMRLCLPCSIKKVDFPVPRVVERGGPAGHACVHTGNGDGNAAVGFSSRCQVKTISPGIRLCCKSCGLRGREEGVKEFIKK